MLLFIRVLYGVKTGWSAPLIPAQNGCRKRSVKVSEKPMDIDNFGNLDEICVYLGNGGW